MRTLGRDRKGNMKNRSFTKFTKRNTHKRRAKDAAKAELLRALRESGTDVSGVKIRDRVDLGRRGRVSSSPHRDESVGTGVYTGSRAGYGFVTLDSGDIFIPEGKSGGAIDGDLVEIVYHSYEGRFGDEKTEGRVRKIVEYGRKVVVGEVEEIYIRHGRRTYREYVLIVDGGKVHPNPKIVGGEPFAIGDIVEARLNRAPYGLECTVQRSFGPADTREANYGAILAEAGIITEFTDEELRDAKNAARIPIQDGERERFDSDTVLTIDGAGAKDLDDAVSLRRLRGGGWRLGVHIADVSYYVRERTPLDRCVMARGTSVYFTDKVVPMLPPSFSNGACSLNAGEDKRAVSALIDLDSRGEITSLELIPTVIRSKVRGVYSEVNAIFDGTADSEVREKYKSVTPTLMKMRELYLVLLEKHKARGAVDFDSGEAEIILDEKGDPCEIIPRERGDAERMIEQFMLTANEAVATEMYRRSVPCVYRIHEAPPEDKMEDFVTYVHNLGFDTSYIRRGEVTPAALSGLLSAAGEKGLFEPISYSMLRAMSKAKYSEIKHPHFGLGIDKYCHFTSPIRRLSDLATHRIIRRVLFEGKPPKQYESYARRAAAAATEGELRAINAERRIEDLYKVIYMSRFIGETMEGSVCSVTRYGLFIRLDNTCEGLVPISEMPGEFFYDEGNVSLVSKNKVYRLGERATVVLEECDIGRGKIRFSIA